MSCVSLQSALVIVLGIYFFGFTTNGQVEDPSLHAEKRLFQDLSANSSRGRPVVDWRQTIQVNLGMQVFQITSLDAVSQVLTILAEIPMDWQDDYLRWNPADYGGIESVVLPADDMWIPDLGIANGAYRFKEHEWRQIFPIRASYTGEVGMGIRTSYQTTCSLDMTYFPFDQQRCPILVSTIISAEREVNLTARFPTINMNYFITSEEWNVDSTYTVDQRRYPFGPDGPPFSEVEFNLCLGRKPMFYVISIVLPSTLLSFLALLMFIIPHESGEKIALGITILLSYVVFMLMVADTVPRNSDSIPILQVYLFVVTVLTALAVITSVLILRLFHMSDPVPPLPPKVRHFLYTISDRCCNSSVGSVKDNDDAETNISDKEKRSSFLTMSSKKKSANQLTPIEDSGQSKYLDSRKKSSVQFDSKNSNEDNKLTEEQRRQEWRMFARLCDKICLVIFLIIIVISTLVSFIPHLTN